MTKRARIETPLKRVLDQEGRRQTWLADQVSARLDKNIDSRQVFGWVHGIHVPEHATREAIAYVLGRTPEDLWPDEYLDQAA